MSRSQPKLTSPVTRIFEWAGRAGELTYFDREAKERKVVKLPFQFLVLDQLSCVTGFSKVAKFRIWSNEIRPENLKTDKIIIRTKGEDLYTGLYDKNAVPRGAGYTQAIYMAYYAEDGSLAIGKFMASGSARGAWFDFRKLHNVENGKVIISGHGELEGDDAIQWYPPIFKWDHSTEEEDRIANQLDGTIQDYLTRYFAAGRSADQERTVATSQDDEFLPNDLPPAEPMGDDEFASLLQAGNTADTIDPNDLPLSMRDPTRGQEPSTGEGN